MAIVISDNRNNARNVQRVKPLYRGTQVVWYILNVIEVALLFRFVLRLLGANQGAGFSQFINAVSYPFVAPFLAVFNPTYVAGATFEWTTLLAMLAYWVLAWGVVRLIVMGKPVSTVEAHEKLSRQDVEDTDHTTYTSTY